MTAYNSTDFDSPAPVAYVTLRNETTGAEWSNVPMQLDTGADVTLVPQTAVNKLGLTVISDVQYKLVGFDGSASFAVAVLIPFDLIRRI
jgi:predicted aspartyl protease